LDEAEQLEIKDEDKYGEFVTLAYLLNPFTIFNCVGQTTTVVGNLMIATGILSMLKGKYHWLCLICAISFAFSSWNFKYLEFS